MSFILPNFHADCFIQIFTILINFFLYFANLLSYSEFPSIFCSMSTTSSSLLSLLILAVHIKSIIAEGTQHVVGVVGPAGAGGVVGVVGPVGANEEREESMDALRSKTGKF